MGHDKIMGGVPAHQARLDQRRIHHPSPDPLIRFIVVRG
jgi:hypothetical protein